MTDNKKYDSFIKRFWKMRRIMKISSGEADLYFFFIHESFLRNWAVKFECPNGIISATLGITEKTLIDVRNRLQQKGLIAFIPGQRKKQSPIYTIYNI